MYMVRIFNGHRFWCMDGIHFNPKDNLEKYGYALEGEHAIVLQIKIGSRTFAVHAVMSERGFEAWIVFEGNVNQHMVANFIESFAGNFPSDAILFLDNASNQNNDIVIDTMNRSLGARYQFNEPYSPELNPIEHGFSMVRCWIRDREDQALANPVETINAAFRHYASPRIGGIAGDHCYHLFDFYRRNYDEYVNESIAPLL